MSRARAAASRSAAEPPAPAASRSAAGAAVPVAAAARTSSARITPLQPGARAPSRGRRRARRRAGGRAVRSGPGHPGGAAGRARARRPGPAPPAQPRPASPRRRVRRRTGHRLRCRSGGRRQRGEDRAHRHLRARLDDERVDDAVVEALHLHRRLRGVDDRDDVAAVDGSPGCTSHSSSVPSVMSAPREGIRNSGTVAHHPSGGGDDVVDLRERRVLEVLRVRRGHLHPAHPLDRRVELVEGAARRSGRSPPPTPRRCATPRRRRRRGGCARPTRGWSRRRAAGARAGRRPRRRCR